MGFDLSTAQAIQTSTGRAQGFDLSTATPVKKNLLSDSLPFIRPIVETGGMIAGGLVGSAEPGGGTVIGAGLGYAAGKRAMDMADRYINGLPAEEVKDIPKNLLSDVATGAGLEMGGQVIGKAVPALWKAGKEYLLGPKTTAISSAGAKKAAGNILAQNLSDGPYYAGNEAVGQEVADAIPGFSLSIGEMRHDPQMLSLQRGLAIAPGSNGANALANRNANNRQSLTNFLGQNFPDNGGIAPVLEELTSKKAAVSETAKLAERQAATAARELPALHPQETGRAIQEELEIAKAPIKARMVELGEQIPDYPMRFDNTFNALDMGLNNKTLSPQDRVALRKLQSEFQTSLDQLGQTTKASIGLRRGVRQLIDDKPELAHALKPVIQGLDGDLGAVSNIIKSGDMAEVGGRLVNLEDMANKMYQNEVLISKLKTKSAKPDWEVMRDELKANGNPANRVAGESHEGYLEWLTRDFKRVTGKDVPYKTDPATEQQIANIQSQIDQMAGQLRQAKPGADVAARIKAYNRYAHDEYFSRFDTESVDSISRFGNKTGGGSRLEHIPTKATTPSGADELIKAVGQEKAAQLIAPHFGHDLLQYATNTQTRELNPKSLTDWVARNSTVLDKYGIKGQFDTVEKATASYMEAKQAQEAFNKSIASKMLNADAPQAIAAAFSGGEGVSYRNTGEIMRRLVDQVKDSPEASAGLRTAFKDHIVNTIEATNKTIAQDNVIKPASFQEVLEKFNPAMEVLYAKHPEQLEAMKLVQKAVETQGRSAYSMNAGSDTAEKLGVLKRLASWAEHAPGIGLPMKIGRAVMSPLYKAGDDEIQKILTKAMFDPELAYRLMADSRAMFNGAKTAGTPLKDAGLRGALVVVNNALAKDKKPVNALDMKYTGPKKLNAFAQ